MHQSRNEPFIPCIVMGVGTTEGCPMTVSRNSAFFDIAAFFENRAKKAKQKGPRTPVTRSGDRGDLVHASGRVTGTTQNRSTRGLYASERKGQTVHDLANDLALLGRILVNV